MSLGLSASVRVTYAVYFVVKEGQVVTTFVKKRFTFVSTSFEGLVGRTDATKSKN